MKIRVFSCQYFVHRTAAVKHSQKTKWPLSCWGFTLRHTRTVSPFSLCLLHALTFVSRQESCTVTNNMFSFFFCTQYDESGFSENRLWSQGDRSSCLSYPPGMLFPYVFLLRIQCIRHSPAALPRSQIFSTPLVLQYYICIL